MTELKLEVGKTYVDRRGNKVLITLNTSHATESHFPFYSNGNTFTSKGTFYAHDEHSRDLISEYVQPAAPVQPAARTPRPHAPLRIDHANGYDIQRLTHEGVWMDTPDPVWHDDKEYRRKPEVAPLKPNQCLFANVVNGELRNNLWPSVAYLDKTATQALRIEFNPNTQELVSAEVVTL